MAVLEAPLAREVTRDRLRGAAVERLLQGAAAGDEAVWASLVERFSGLLRGVAGSYRLGHADAEDVCQSTWLRLLGNADRVREPRALAGWLRTTAHREALHQLADARRERPTDQPLLADQPAPGPDPTATVLARERHDLLARAVATLPERQRALLALLADEAEPGYAEISRALGMPIGSIGPTRARCLARLRADADLAAAHGTDD
jgi:RNA polymerase sigma factor (sigma-70 family)